MRLLLVLLCLLLATSAAAIDEAEQLDDPALEARARDLFKEVRCVVCQNQSIDDSEAQIARDLRVLIREQLVAGRGEEEVLLFLTERYGDYVLLEPPFRPSTLLLWLAPPIVLALGFLLVWHIMTRRPKPRPPAPLSAAEQARLDALVKRYER